MKGNEGKSWATRPTRLHIDFGIRLLPRLAAPGRTLAGPVRHLLAQRSVWQPLAPDEQGATAMSADVLRCFKAMGHAWAG